MAPPFGHEKSAPIGTLLHFSVNVRMGNPLALYHVGLQFLSAFSELLLFLFRLLLS